MTFALKAVEDLRRPSNKGNFPHERIVSITTKSIKVGQAARHAPFSAAHFLVALPSRSLALPST
jgi:hypothetical protein